MDPRRVLRPRALDYPIPPDSSSHDLIPLHNFILPVPNSLSPPLPLPPVLHCEHLVAKALGVPTLVEVDDLDPDRHRNNSSPTATGTAGGIIFSCNLCLEVAAEPVVTACGHLFCWPCLFYAVRFAGGCCSAPCLVCGSEVSIGEDGNVVPIDGRGAEGVHRGEGVPERPKAKREESMRESAEPWMVPQRSAEWLEAVRVRIGAAVEGMWGYGLGEEFLFGGESWIEEPPDGAGGMEGNAGAREVDGMRDVLPVSRRRRLS